MPVPAAVEAVAIPHNCKLVVLMRSIRCALGSVADMIRYNAQEGTS